MKKSSVAVLVAAIVTVTPVPATAATVLDTGWWTRNPAATAPEGGFQVALAAGEPLSVAAIRLNTPDPVTSATLTLEEGPNGYRQDAAQLRLCPTASDWFSADGGSYDSAPEPNCDAASAALTRTDGQWTAQVGALIPRDATSVSLMVVPVGDATLPIDPGYEVQVVRVSVQAQTAEVFDTPTFDTTDVAPAAPPAPLPAPALAPAPLPAPATASEPEVPDPAPVEEFSPFAAPVAQDGRGEPRPWGRLGLFIPLAGLAGLGGFLIRRLLLTRGWAQS